MGAQVPADSTIVAKLREAGLIILGKTDLSQWANFRSLNSSNGWSAYGGQTYGAYYPKQDPSGSSSGSGVASDLGLAFAAIGTEASSNISVIHMRGKLCMHVYLDITNYIYQTSGSIISPSEMNNIVGIKPTVGLTSRYMVVPISERQDTVGPMARTVKDAAKILQVIAGKDPNDNYTLASPFETSRDLPDYVAACNVSGLAGRRIGIPRNVIDAGASNSSSPVMEAFESAISIIATAGATIVEDTNFTAFDVYTKSNVPDSVLYADFISDIAKYLAGLKTNPNDLHDLADIRRFTQNFPSEDYPDRDTGIWDSALAANITNTSPAFWPLYQQNLYFGGEGGVLGALERHNLDAVILPTSFAASIPALVGSPVVTVPLGAYPADTPVKYNGRGDLVQVAPRIPFGISFLGAKWSEEALIGMAYAFEQRTLVREKLERYIAPQTELVDNVQSGI